MLARGKTVLLETGGHRSTSRVPEPVVTILDIKCPGSGEADRMDWENLNRLRSRDEVKFVIKDRADYDYARSIIERFGLATAFGHASARIPGTDTFYISTRRSPGLAMRPMPPRLV